MTVTTNTDCRYYRGHIPCTHHKQHGIHCDDCKHCEALKERILIIKLGAAGDVIRTTPLLRRLKVAFPRAEITWLTYSPACVPSCWVDNTLDFNLANMVWLEQQRFDWLINLDKDREAIALVERIAAGKKSGFRMNAFGKCVPMGQAAEEAKWQTGLWDDVNKLNRLNYMEEIFAICGYTFNGEEYILDVKENNLHKIKGSKTVVGLNTGCGARWITRLWPDAYWTELAKMLISRNYDVVFLGGPPEDEKNRSLAAESGASYYGTMELDNFYGLVNQCDVVVTQVTMAMHVAIALKKYLVLMNNIFNRNEFFLYNHGTIVEPNLDCLGCFKQRYNERCKSANCMEMITPSRIMAALESRP